VETLAPSRGKRVRHHEPGPLRGERAKHHEPDLLPGEKVGDGGDRMRGYLLTPALHPPIFVG
jgi:hypothetical protein